MSRRTLLAEGFSFSGLRPNVSRHTATSWLLVAGPGVEPGPVAYEAAVVSVPPPRSELAAPRSPAPLVSGNCPRRFSLAGGLSDSRYGGPPPHTQKNISHGMERVEESNHDLQRIRLTHCRLC